MYNTTPLYNYNNYNTVKNMALNDEQKTEKNFNNNNIRDNLNKKLFREREDCHYR